jgi:hypothetical protein
MSEWILPAVKAEIEQRRKIINHFPAGAAN